MRLPLTSDPSYFEHGQATIQSELDDYIQRFYGHSLTDLLAPVGETEVGESVRHNGVYFKIKEARSADDPTLPQGVWVHDLKTADWETVESIALDTLSHKSKDLQLAVWLMESSVNRYGFAGIAPATVILQSLCEKYWQSMHPQMLDDDIEFRTNPISWLNEKMALQLRLTAVTSTQLEGKELSWDDWDNAQRRQKLSKQNNTPKDWQGTTVEAFKQRLKATDTQFFIQLCADLEDGIQAIGKLTSWLDDRCGIDSPSLGEITRLLEQLYTMLESELADRGVLLQVPEQLAASEDSEKDDIEAEDCGQLGGMGDGGSHGSNRNPIDREEAFAGLARIAKYLKQDDPHSPVPYLVETAVDWGKKSAPELYQELFVELQGMLNIFEIMGIKIKEDESD